MTFTNQMGDLLLHMTNCSVNESFVFKLSLKEYMLRILILGSRVNNYDQRTKKISAADIDYINEQITAGHGAEIHNIVHDVYMDSRAPKLDSSLLVIALLCKATDKAVSKMGLQLLTKFRTISHLYSWKNFHSAIVNPATGEKSKGFGRAVKREISNWTLHQSAADLAYQITKYMSREGWSFKNILQCTHICTKTGDDRVFEPRKAGAKTSSKPKVNQHNVPPTEMDLVLRYAVNGFESMEMLAKKAGLEQDGSVYTYLKAVHDAKHCIADNKTALIALVYQHKLTREQVPTWALTETDILTALLLNTEKTRVTMPLTALLRNLGNMTAHLVFAETSTLQLVLNHLLNPVIIKNAHIHPVSVLMAWFTYRSGAGHKGHNRWVPENTLVKTLEEMFYLSFKNVAPTGKRICFLIDCSGSMTGPSLCEGVTNAEAAALLAMIFARSETDNEHSPSHSFYLFTSIKKDYVGRTYYTGCGSNTGLTDVSDVIDANAPLNTVLKTVQSSDWGTTDISMGILDALKYKRKYDAFVVITDNDVNSGIKPSEAMQQYRVGMKMPTAKLAVFATKGSDVTIADPMDIHMLDMCGFDSHGPKILQEFIRD